MTAADGAHLPLVRSDALVDDVDWGEDDGCDLFARCLECPLPKCRYDSLTAAEVHNMVNAARNAEIVRLYVDGELIENIAQRLGVSRRSVFRITKVANVRRGWPTVR